MLKTSLLLRKMRTYELITRELLGLRMRSFQGIIFIYTLT